jgi:hypothetical protein
MPWDAHLWITPPTWMEGWCGFCLDGADILEQCGWDGRIFDGAFRE